MKKMCGITTKEIWTYENGKLNGLHYLLNNSGRVDMYESFLDGKLHGKRVTYKQGSPVEEMSYKNGQLDGIFRGFFPTGKLQRIGNFVNGKQDGKYIVYDENKQIILQANYNNTISSTFASRILSHKDPIFIGSCGQ